MKLYLIASGDIIYYDMTMMLIYYHGTLLLDFLYASQVNWIVSSLDVAAIIQCLYILRKPLAPINVPNHASSVLQLFSSYDTHVLCVMFYIVACYCIVCYCMLYCTSVVIVTVFTVPLRP